MPYHKTVKTLVSGALAFTLMTGGGLALPREAYAAAMTTPFTDVAPGHWSEKHVAKLYYQGIINGYMDNNIATFKPNQSITQQEAVLMTLRFAGLDKLAASTAAPIFPPTFKLNSFYSTYIKLAFDKGLLDQQEEFELAAADTKKDWGSKVATREWVTKLIVKAIGKEDEAKRLQNATSVFADEKQFDEKYASYIKAASGLGLVKGVTETTFSPKGDVTRASLATILSRAQSTYPIGYTGQVSGIITAISDNSVTLHNNNQFTTYSIDSNTLFYHYNTETPIAKKDLLLYGDAMIIVKDGRAAYIEVMGSKQHMKTLSGTLGRVVESEKTMYLWINNDYEKIVYDDATEIVDTNGQAVKLSSLKSDTAVTVIQDTFRSEPKALKITAAAQALKSSVSGTYIGFDNNLISVEEASGQIQSFYLADKPSIELDGLPEAALEDLIKKDEFGVPDQITMTLDSNSRVVNIKVTNRSIKSLNDAKIASYVSSSKLLTILDGNGENPAALLFTERSKIYYNGSLIGIATAESMLRENRKVKISYTGNKVVAIHFITKYDGVLTGIEASKNSLSIKLSDDSVVSVKYASPVVEIAEKGTGAMSDLKAGDKLTVELNYAQELAATIKVHSSEQYEVESIEPYSNRLRVKKDNGTSLDVYLTGSKLLSESGAEMKLDAIKAGSIINVTYEGRTAATIQLVAATVGKVTAIGANSVTIEDMYGKSAVFIADGGFIVIKGSTISHQVSALTVGDYVEATLTAAKQVRLKIATTETRTYTTYSATNKQLWTVISYDGDNRNYFYLTDQTKIVHNGAAIPVTSLKSGDVLKIISFRNIALEIVKS